MGIMNRHLRLEAESGRGYEAGLGGGMHSSLNPEELTIHGLLVILRRRRRVILTIAGLCFLAAVLLCVFMTRQYRAATTIQVQKGNSDSLGLNSLTNEARWLRWMRWTRASRWRPRSTFSSPTIWR